MPSILENVVANVETTLLTINTGNGYNYTVAAVQRIQQQRTSVKDIPALLIISRDVRKPDSEPWGVQDWILALEIELAFVHDEAAAPTESTDEVYFKWFGDITKALLTDRTRGGHAIDTNIVGMEPLPVGTENRLAGIIVDAEVRFRHRYGDATVPI